MFTIIIHSLLLAKHSQTIFISWIKLFSLAESPHPTSLRWVSLHTDKWDKYHEYE